MTPLIAPLLAVYGLATVPDDPERDARRAVAEVCVRVFVEWPGWGVVVTRRIEQCPKRASNQGNR